MIICQLGGNPFRSRKTLELQEKSPIATVILTGVENLDETLNMLRRRTNILVDTEALDTLGNFIHTRKWIRPGDHVLLVTDKHHVFRSLGLARLVWGPDVLITPCTESVEGGRGPETLVHCVIDWCRAIAWKITGLTVVRHPGLRILYLR
jgi:hypothetical protein